MVFYNTIVATDSAYGIGREGNIPWHLKPDLAYFRKMTQHSFVIMGRTTYFSIPEKYRPLSNRVNIVLTNNPELLKKTNIEKRVDLVYCKFIDLNYYIAEIKKTDIRFANSELFIIGGSKIYELFAKSCEHNVKNIYLTYIYKNFKCDCKFPLINCHYKLTNIGEKLYDADSQLYYRFCKWEFTSGKYEDIDECKYLKIAHNLLYNGEERIDRTGVGTLAQFGTNIVYDISTYIPALTTKKVPFKTCLWELLWFLQGKTDNQWLQERGVHIWDGNSSREYLDSIGLTHLREGDCGACYGFQWCHFGATYNNCETDYTGQGINQIEYVLDLLRNNPQSRRILISAWNPADLGKTCLPPCHMSIQFFVSQDSNGNQRLSGQMYQRSADWFLGEPFNILSYTILLYILAMKCDMKPDKLIITTGDTHIYKNHIEQMKEQITRNILTQPKLIVNPEVKYKKFVDIIPDDFELFGYFSHPTIKGKMAI